MSVVRIDGRRVPRGAAALHPDDPLARAGEGLIETMRAASGRVPLLDRHLARMRASAETLGLAGIPGDAAVRAEVGLAVAAAGDGDLRVRVCVSARPTLWVEATPIAPLPAAPPGVEAVTVPGGWLPGLRVAEHKTASRAQWAWADRRARQAGAGAALLLDGAGRMGEATVANVVVVTGGAAWTAPAEGLLPGVGRAVVLAAVPAIGERAVARAEWEAADEILLVSAVSGTRAVTRVDGRPVGDGAPGPWARRLQEVLREAMGPGRGPGPG